jgi:hypothetical protein
MKTWAICALGSVLLGWAGEAGAASFCNGVYSDDPVAMKLAHVVGHPPWLLMATPSDCRPNENGCRWPLTLAPGTLVTTFQSAEGLVCVEAAPDGGRRRWGWLPEGNIQADQEQSPVSSKWWVGQWAGQGYNEISISREGGKLHGEGYAESGPHDNPRFGGFDGLGASSNGEVNFQEDDGGDEDSGSGCHVRVVRFGSQIAVMDNNKCGAMTRVSGFYRRTSMTPAPKGSVVGRGG